MMSMAKLQGKILDAKEYLDKQQLNFYFAYLSLFFQNVPETLICIIAEYVTNLRKFSFYELALRENAPFAGFASNPSMCGVNFYEFETQFMQGKNVYSIDRLNISLPHELSAKLHLPVDDLMYVSTDNMFISIRPTCADEGPYYQDNPHSTSFKIGKYDNVGGVHFCVIDTKKPKSNWLICTQLKDATLIRAGVKYDMNIRLRFITLVQKNYAKFTSSYSMIEDECSGLLEIGEIYLPTGKLSIGTTHSQTVMICKQNNCNCSTFFPYKLPSGLGDGYYPVGIQKAMDSSIHRIQIQFLD